MADKSELDIIKELYNSFGNNPNNVETFNTLANVNPLLAAYRGAKTLANVAPSSIAKALRNEAYGINNTADNRAAWNQIANTASGVMDVVPTLGMAKVAAKPTAKALGKALAMTENMPVGLSIKDVSRPLTDFEKAHKLAQQRAALPVSEGGLGLHPENTYIDRANAMGADDVYHGTAETEPITAIDPLKLGSATKSASAKKAFWGVDDPTTAEGYANHAAMDAKVQDLIDKSQAAERSAHGGIFPRSEAEKQKYFQLSEDLMQQAQDLEAMFANNQNQGQNIMPLKIMNRNQATMDAGGNTFMDMQDEMHGILNNAIENKYPSVKISNLSDEIDWGRYNPATHYGVIDPTVIRSRFAAFDPFRRNENDIMAGVGAGLPFVDYNKKK